MEDGQDLGGQESGGEGRLQMVQELSAIPRCFLVPYLVCFLEELPWQTGPTLFLPFLELGKRALHELPKVPQSASFE